MLPFCGYHMGDYFRHWIQMQRALSETPKIFHVNWFRKGADGAVPVAGVPENMRVLKWIVDRVHGRVLGAGDADRLDAALAGHRLDRARLRERHVRCAPAGGPEDWRREVIEHEELFIDLHDHLPPEMVYERELLICRL